MCLHCLKVRHSLTPVSAIVAKTTSPA
jgi:hypothetical protein